MHISVISVNQIQLKQACYTHQISKLKKESDKSLNLQNTFIEMKKESFIVEDKKVVFSNLITTKTACDVKNNSNPTSISDYLLNGAVELPNNIISVDTLLAHHPSQHQANRMK